MINGKHMILAGLTIVLVLAGMRTVRAESARRLVAEGNRSFASGKYDEASSAYEKAAVAEPGSARIFFNQAAAAYMRGNYQQAIDLFEKAAVKSRATELEARSHYNMGNSYFRESERQRDSDLEKSLATLRQSIAAYQKGLELDAKLSDAAHNIEVARLIMKKVLDELEKRQEQATEQRKKQQEIADNLDDLIKQQEKLADRTKELADRTGQEESRGNKADMSDDLADQQEVSEETEKLKNQVASQPEAGDQAGEGARHLRKAQDRQAAAEKRLARNDPNEAHSAQEEAAAELKKAKEALAKKGEKGDNQPRETDQPPEQEQPDQQEPAQQQAGAASDPEAQDGTGEQAATRLEENPADILNEEKENRRQRHFPGSGYRPVERDW